MSINSVKFWLNFEVLYNNEGQILVRKKFFYKKTFCFYRYIFV